MSIVFCNIAWMERYRGVTDKDKPFGGFSWVVDNNDAFESYNFAPLTMPKEITIANDYLLEVNQTYCLGFFETMSTRNGRKKVSIENIAGAELLVDEDYADGVTVVWCASKKHCIVGWYKNATVLRSYANFKLEGDSHAWFFNVAAKEKDCILLPIDERQKSKWYIPRAKRDNYGFGQSNIWYATKDEKSRAYASKITSQIREYSGINAMNLV